jgi:hypothetical protein
VANSGTVISEHRTFGMLPMTTNYLLAKEKLAQLEARLAALNARTDLNPVHRAEVKRSYEEMIRQYRHDLKLFEAAHSETIQSTETSPSPAE